MKDRKKDKRDNSRPLRPLSVDPTRTSGLRRKFIAQLRRQFSSLKVAVMKFVGEGDAFGVTANVERHLMPQVRKDDWQEFLEFVKAKTIVTEEPSVNPNTLHAVQSEFSQKRVDAIPIEKLKYPILVSLDGYVMDGNHRWIKAAQTSTSIPVIRIGLDRDECLALIRSFPKAEYVTNAVEFQFHSDPDKVKAFQEWLKQQLAALIIGKTEEELWERFIQEGFRRGGMRAFDDVNVAKRAAKYGGDEKLDFYNGTREEFLRSSFGRPVAVEKVKLLAGRSFDELENVTADMSNKMSRVLVDGLVQGKGPRDIARDMTKEVDLSFSRATVIARTEIVRAHSEGQLEAFENLGIEEVGAAVEFSDSKDDRVCPACEALEGIVLKLEEAHGIIPVHPGCLTGDSLVLSGSPIAAVSKRWYDGDLVVFKTASGRELSCTPNHPILTDRGWVPARMLDVGSDVVSDGASDWEVPIKNHYQNVPTSIHDISEAFRRSLVVSTREVPVSTPDFHGDGLGSEVAVIWTDGSLRREKDTTGFKKLTKFDFIIRDVYRLRSLLTSLRGKALFLKSLYASTSSGVSPGNLFTTLLHRHACPLNGFGLRLVTSSNPREEQHALNRPARNRIPFTNGVLGIPVQVGSNNFTDRKVCKSTNSPIVAPKNAHNDFSRDAELAREISNGSTGPVLLDKVVSFVVKHFHGHVYNLETEKGFYAANGIITHNCRCAFTPANVGEDSKGQKDTKKSIDRAFKTAQETADVEPGARISKSRPESILGNSSLPQKDRLGALLERFSDYQLVGNYDPAEARDDKGEWTDGGTSSVVPAPPALVAAPQLPAKTFDNKRDCIKWADAGFSAWSTKVSNSEFDAIDEYVSPSYSKINKSVRRLDPTKVPKNEYSKTISNLDTVISKGSTPEDVVAYRGLNKAPFLRGLKAGQVIQDNGFVSTSLLKSTAEKFADTAIMEIRIPKGSKAAAIDAVIDPKDNSGGEQELVLPRGSRFKILEVHKEGKRSIIRAEVTNDLPN